MYATKRRRRNVKTFKHAPKENQKSNPSKRHRERLNTELENLANLLPFEQTILTKLDKLSILRLAVSYLRIKSYFQVKLKISNYLPLSSSTQQQQPEHERNRYPQLYYMDPNFSEGNALLDSLNGFILIANTNSEVFYASRTVEQYLGFHQSDIIHQSIYELIHSEDREEFKRQLNWNLKLSTDKTDITLNDLLTKKEYSRYLDRNFTVRFRCLLDNTSGFVTLDIIGRLSILYGQRNAIDISNENESKQQNYKAKNSKIINNNNNNLINLNDNDGEPILALFAIAVPFGPPSLFELPQRDTLFRTKHKVNLAPLTLDPRGKLILGYNEKEFSQLGGYDLIHMDDLKYYSNAHKELIKTGTSGLVCYRVLNKDKNWQWIQSSMRIIYKSNKPECVIANHRPLTSDEGEELYYKRGLEFKLPYLCLYDFEANFNSLVNNVNYSSNNSNCNNLSSIIEEPNKPISVIGRSNLNNNNNNNLQVTSKQYSNGTLNQQSSVSKSSINGVLPNKSKITKNTKTSTNRSQIQKYSTLCRNEPQLLLNQTDGNYFNGLPKIENYSLFEPTTSSSSSSSSGTLPLTPNDYQTFSTDNSHHYQNYTNYFNTLNGYNYTNYTTPYSLYANPNNLHNNQQLTNSCQNSLTEVSFSINQSSTPSTTSTTWLDDTNQQISKLGQNPYSLINYSNTSTQSNYLFNNQNQNQNPTTNSYYIDDYNQSNAIQSNNIYDYNNKYNHNNLLSRSTSSSTSGVGLCSSIDNSNHKKEQNFMLTQTISPSSIKVSSTCSSSNSSCSSSTSPSIIPINNQISTISALQDHNNNTNTLYLQNNDFNSTTNGLYKNFQNELKVQSNDRTSLHSFSTPSSCSSSSSNYCDESAVKSFIKQENCMLELAVGLNNSNSIRNGFLMDYYNDFYQNNVSI